ncbi:MAG: hypothetical protein GX843_05380, partial [Synergistaceae bacterium]|nr:hypothetical protein [Synergistaceae bacterium]
MKVKDDVIKILEMPKILAGFAPFVRGELGLLGLENLRPARNAEELSSRVSLFADYVSC